MGLYLVIAMTVNAIRHIFITGRIGLSVSAVRIFIGYFCMAVGASHLSGRYTGSFMTRCDICMTFHTRNIAVPGVCEILSINLQRYFFSVDNLMHICFFMTGQTGTV